MVYGPIAGKNVTIYVAGTATSYGVSTQACTEVSGTVYKIATDAKRIIDPATALVLEKEADGGGGYSAVSEADYTVDYLFGTITFAVDPVATVRVKTGKYLPMVPIIVAKSASLAFSNNPVDCTVFGDTATRKACLFQSLTGSMETIAMELTDITAASSITANALSGQAWTVFEWRFSANSCIRAFVVFDTRTQSLDVNDLVKGTWNFTGTLVDPVDSTSARLSRETLWGFGDPTI